MKTKDILRNLMGDISSGHLSRETGVAQTTIHRILTGEIGESKPSTLRPIANYFGISLAQLQGDAPILDCELTPKEVRRLVFENDRCKHILRELVRMYDDGELSFKDDRLPISFLWWMQDLKDKKNKS